MFIFHFNGGKGIDYVVVAESYIKAIKGLIDMGVPEIRIQTFDVMSSAPVHVTEVVTIRCRSDRSFAMHTTSAR